MKILVDILKDFNSIIDSLYIFYKRWRKTFLYAFYSITKRDMKNCKIRFDLNEKSCRVKENTKLTQIFRAISLFLFLLMYKLERYIFGNGAHINDLVFENVFKGIIIIFFVLILIICFLLFFYRILSGVGEQNTAEGETGDYVGVEKFSSKSCKFETFVLTINMFVLVLSYTLIIYSKLINMALYLIALVYIISGIMLLLHKKVVIKKARYTSYLDKSDILVIHLKRHEEQASKLEFLVNDIEFFVKLNQDIYIWDWDWDSDMMCHPISYIFPKENIDYIEIENTKIVYQNDCWVLYP